MKSNELKNCNKQGESTTRSRIEKIMTGVVLVGITIIELMELFNDDEF